MPAAKFHFAQNREFPRDPARLGRKHMESWQQVLAAYPLLRTLWDAVCICVPLAALFAYAGLFFLSATAKILSICRKRAAYDKCSRQTALLGLILGWLLLIGIRVWLYYSHPERQDNPSLDFLLEMSWLLLSLGVLLSSIYYTLWRILKNMPILHVTLGMLSAVQNCVALVALLFCLRLSAAVVHPDTAMLRLPDLFPTSWDSSLWSAACYALPLLFAMPGAFSAFWLVLRRKHDDFGRDYYNSMLPWCAGWAFFPWSLLWLTLLVSTSMQIWLGLDSASFSMDETIWDCARLCLWLLPLAIWFAIRKSAAPMRFKLANFLALLIAISFMIPFFLELSEI